MFSKLLKSTTKQKNIKTSILKLNTITKYSTLTKDKVIQDIVDYTHDFDVTSEEALKVSRYTIMDALGCGILALSFKECTKLLGPVVEGITVENGVRVPGTGFELDPVTGAFNIGAMIRWLDYNDTWLAAEWYFLFVFMNFINYYFLKGVILVIILEQF